MPRLFNTQEGIAAAHDWQVAPSSDGLIAHRCVALLSVLRGPVAFKGCSTVADIAQRHGMAYSTLRSLRRELRVVYGMVSPGEVAKAKRRLNKPSRLDRLEAELAKIDEFAREASIPEVVELFQERKAAIIRKIQFISAINQENSRATSLNGPGCPRRNWEDSSGAGDLKTGGDTDDALED